MNVVKTRIDSKGRISIPYYMRSMLGIDDSSKLKIAASEREIFLTPSGESIKARIRFRNFPSLLRAMKIIAENKINIAHNQLVNFGSVVEWSAVLEGDINNIKHAIKKVRKMKRVKLELV